MRNTYLKIVKEYIKKASLNMLKEGTGVFKHPFIDPGAGYEENLWDWDSYFSAYALMDICEYFKHEKDFDYKTVKEKVGRHAKGNILNFLDLQHEDGFIAMVTTAQGLFSDYLSNEHRCGKEINQHKPFLCSGTLNVCDFTEDYHWFDLKKILKYMDYYEKNQYDNKSGLFYWKNDLMIGIDNNPTVFGRPDNSCADIYLNSFLYNEYICMAKLLNKLGDNRSKSYLEKSQSLKAAIRREMFDIRDGLYYSVDIQVKTNKTEYFNHGIGAFWKTVPLKVRIWACFLPMMFGISTTEENKLMIEKHYLDDNFLSEFGIRTLSKDEKMYNTTNSSNPSNWLGAIWIVASFCVFKGLMAAGRKDLAEDLAEKTIRLLGLDIEKNGKMSESYVPETGQPMMYGGFLNWNCLAISMLKELNT